MRLSRLFDNQKVIRSLFCFEKHVFDLKLDEVEGKIAMSSIFRSEHTGYG